MATELSSRIARLKALASFAPRPLRPGFSGREPFEMPEGLRQTRQRILDQAASPYIGITTDGTPLAGEKIRRVLTNDPGMGVIRHVDAGYDRAVEVAAERGVRVPSSEG